jgi:hypothetical protein
LDDRDSRVRERRNAVAYLKSGMREGGRVPRIEEAALPEKQ